MISVEITKRLHFRFVILAAAAMLVPAGSINLASRVDAASKGLVIHQLQTGGSVATQEFVSLMNLGNEVIDVTGLCIEYVTASGATRNDLACLDPPEFSVRLMLGPKHSLTFATSEFKTANQNVVVDKVFTSGISATSGHIRIVDTNDNLVDAIGWGSATQPETLPVAAHATGKLLQRVTLTGTDYPADTDNNSLDFISSSQSYVNGGNLIEEKVAVDEQKIVLITELLPDPGGSDSGREFIEFFNPNQESVNLNEFRLLIKTSNQKTYEMPDKLIQPNTYVALSDTDIGYVLPNTAAEVSLEDSHGAQISSSDKYSDIGENVAWALSSQSWQSTYLPTPGGENQILAAKPCPASQERNEATGFCRNIGSTDNPAGQSACLPGRERNPETGRCRIVAVAESKAACKINQVRNQETGRCRNVQATENKTCPDGQERNAETGRCRKIPGSGKPMAEVKDVAAPLIASNAKWWIAGASAAGSVGYGAYEWRGDLRKWLFKAREKLFGGPDS